MFVKQTKNEKTGRILRRTRNSQVLVLTQLCYHTRHTIIPVTRYTFRTLLDTCLFRDGFHFYANQKPLPRACQFLIRSTVSHSTCIYPPPETTAASPRLSSVSDRRRPLRSDRYYSIVNRRVSRPSDHSLAHTT